MEMQEHSMQQLVELQKMWFQINDVGRSSHCKVNDDLDKGTGFDKEHAKAVFIDKFKTKFGNKPHMQMVPEVELNRVLLQRSAQDSTKDALDTKMDSITHMFEDLSMNP